MKHTTPQILGETMAVICCNKRHHEPSQVSISFVSTFLRFLCHLLVIDSFSLCHFWYITPYICFLFVISLALCVIFFVLFSISSFQFLCLSFPFSLFYFSIFFVILTYFSFSSSCYLSTFFVLFLDSSVFFALLPPPHCDLFPHFLSDFGLHNISVFLVLHLVARPEINRCKMAVNADTGNRSFIFSSPSSGCSPCR